MCERLKMFNLIVNFFSPKCRLTNQNGLLLPKYKLENEKKFGFKGSLSQKRRVSKPQNQNHSTCYDCCTQKQVLFFRIKNFYVVITITNTVMSSAFLK
jgi:hypothetical protein